MAPISQKALLRAASIAAAGAAGLAGAALARRRARRPSLEAGPPRGEPLPPRATPEPPPPPSSSEPPPAAGETPGVAPEPEEAELAEAVRSALRDAAGDAAAGVEVEVAGAMVVLRGRVDSAETIRALERAAAAVSGVEGVRVLLHLPGRRSG